MLKRLLVAGMFLISAGVHAESGYEAWLRYERLDAAAVRQYQGTVPAAVIIFGESGMVASAKEEMIRGVRGMLGRTLRVETRMPSEEAILVGTLAELRKTVPQLVPAGSVGPEGYWLRAAAWNHRRYVIVTGGDERGLLYGAFALLLKISMRESVAEVDEKQAPSAKVRWLNLWDVMGAPRGR